MSEMVVRVAKALRNAKKREDGLRDDTAMALAAIAAMREPTEEMLEAGRSVTATWLNIEGSGLTIAIEKMRRRWGAMIDAALAGKAAK